MRTHPTPRRQAAQGLSLIELLVYIAVLLVISGVAFSAVHRLWTATARASAATDDCASALRAAEQWRRDIRNAHGPVRIDKDGTQCVVPGEKGTIVWTSGMGALWRQVGDQPASLWVARVKWMRFASDPRLHVTPVRCDLILTPRSLQARQAPAFSFLAVPTELAVSTP